MEINSKTKTNAKVTIVCVTYNHEQYIKECLDSLVNQKTNFQYQIFVGEDCSTDQTRKIVEQYVNKYPNLIIPFYRVKNLGSTENFIDLCERVNTPYFAFCDGDDFWTDNDRLQKQYDFMENHLEYNACFCRASIMIDDQWALENFYKKEKKGLIYPDCQPHFNCSKNVFTVKEMASSLPAQAVNVFVRRNVKIEKLPKWMHNIYICDAPLIFLHIGRGKVRFIKDNMCVYRKSSSGIFFHKDLNEHMIKTRPQYIKYLFYLRNFFDKWYGGWAKDQFETRIRLEVNNYFDALIKTGHISRLNEIVSNDSEIAAIAVEVYLPFLKDQNRFISRFNLKTYLTLMRNKTVQILIYPLIKGFSIFDSIYSKMKKVSRGIKKKIRNCVKDIMSFFLYHIATLIPKKKNRWVFTSFKQQGYLDNSKYFFEYVAKNHSNIDAIWISNDKNILEKLKEMKFKCCKARSIKGFFTVATSTIAVTDHFRVTDYPSVLGFNARTKVVQLWHGVGFKSMGNKKEVKNTTVPGVVYSYDIITTSSDSIFRKICKKVKRFFVAHKRELFEEYFALICPGQERIDLIGNLWNIPKDKYIYAGHPRNKPVYMALNDKNANNRSIYNIIYAPTYRNSAGCELDLVEKLIVNLPKIQKFMEQINGTFTLRMHPHTWRDYSNKINAQVSLHNRIKISTEKDIYPSLANYDLMITDYSSISLDFVLFGKPVIYFVEDYERFVKTDAGFNVDFFAMTPGPKARNWTEIYKNINIIMKDKKWPNQAEYDNVLKYFFDKNSNSEDNSKIIADELLKRLGHK